VRKEIDSLLGVTADLKQYVHRRIAHRDEEHFLPPGSKYIDGAVTSLDRLAVRYLNLFRGSSMKTTLPTSQYDWKQIFRHRWLIDQTELHFQEAVGAPETPQGTE
jgi:hypothetical protein